MPILRPGVALPASRAAVSRLMEHNPGFWDRPESGRCSTGERREGL